MASLAQHRGKAPIKCLLVGDSGAGKTGALASLAAAGFNLRILDIDKGVDILGNLLADPNSIYYKKDPKSIDRVDVVQLSDTMKSVNGLLVPSKVVGWQRLTQFLMNWKDGEVDLGPVASWGPQEVLVIDSLSGLAKLALNYHLFLNGGVGKMRTQNEARRDIGATQNYLRDLLELLADDNIKCNIIVISHITQVTEAGGAPQISEGKFENVPTGYPSAIGRALSPHIPRWFNNMLIARAVMQGNKPVHKIFTQSQNLGNQIISGKSSAPMKVKVEYPLETGLADFFEDLRK
jgi:hypothetical protein